MSGPALHRLLNAAALAALTLACAPDVPPGPPDGARLFQTQSCMTCHKEDGRGGPLGPPLKHVAEYWSREELAKYLVDPGPYIESDTRLGLLARNYSQRMLPARLEGETLMVLVDYVLALSKAPAPGQ